MEEFYLDLSDKIFIHRDFVEVIDLKITKGMNVTEWLEHYDNDSEGEAVRFQISTWNGVKLEPTSILAEALRFLLGGNANVVGLEYY